jgi:hypothetical protein
MPNAAAVAEWILSLVTTQERASATVGDCLEGTRGTVSFWRFILRTAISTCARDTWDSRWRLCRLSVWALVPRALLVAILLHAPMMLINYLGGAAYFTLTPAREYWLEAAVITGIVPFIMGRIVARRSDGREIAAALTFAILPGTIGLLMDTALALFSHQTLKLNFPVYYDAIFILAGALSWRARHPRPA